MREKVERVRMLSELRKRIRSFRRVISILIREIILIKHVHVHLVSRILGDQKLIRGQEMIRGQEFIWG